MLFLPHTHTHPHPHPHPPPPPTHPRVVVDYTYFRAYVHLMFKHAVLGTQIGCLGCLFHTRNVLFNDVLNTFYLRLYGIRHMVKATQLERERKPAAATWATIFD